MGHLNHDEIREVHDAILSAHLVDSRQALLTCIDAGFVATIPVATAPSQQILHDLGALNDVGRLDDGNIPLVTWLSNAEMLSKARQEAAIFRAMGAKVAGAGAPRGPAMSRPAKRSSANFAGMSSSTWDRIPTDIRTRIEEWERAKTHGKIFATISVAVSAGCTVWGFDLGGPKHDPYASSRWYAALVVTLAITLVSWISVLRWGYRHIYGPRQEVCATDEEAEWWEALEVTRRMRAERLAPLTGSIWLSRASVDLVVLVNALCLLILAVGKPPAR